MSLARCIYNCEDNGYCENECVAQFKGRTADCPCEVGTMISHTVLVIQFDLEMLYGVKIIISRRTVQVDVHATPSIVKISAQQLQRHLQQQRRLQQQQQRNL